MSTYRLDHLFAPRSVAVIGASPRDASVGRHVVKNLADCRFPGALQVVNPNHPMIENIATIPTLERMAQAPDLIVVAVPPASVPATIAEAGARGVGAAIILTAGLGHGPGSLAEATLDAARPHGIRLIGPNCLGVMRPAAHLNASFAAHAPRKGDLALISQSGAIATGMVEWAERRGVGFSAVVSLGDQLDVDLGDCLDYFALDPETRSILLYVEAVRDARKFMSAARAAARAKPVVIVKSGRHAQGARAAATHTGALAGSDAVYDAAFRRAGLLRVRGLDELFAAAETLGHLHDLTGKRLAILTNGGGVGVLAVDRLADLGGTLATLSAPTVARLNEVLPSTWSRSNPVDIVGDADADRYARALDALLGDSENDAVLVMNVPTALASPEKAADAVVKTIQAARGHGMAKPVFTVWIGAEEAAAADFESAGIPRFANESDAVEGFMNLVRYREAQDALLRTPPSLPEGFSTDPATARRIVEGALSAGKTWLDPIEIAGVLGAYGIPVASVALATNATEAAAAAEPLLAQGQSVVVKILSPDIVHKSDIGGVRLNLPSVEAVAAATSDILARARAAKPDARITGVTIHPMIRRPHARELIAGIARDSTFGPVIVFGAGGTAVEVVSDKALALPPLDLELATDLIGRTRIARLMKAYRDVPAADESAARLVLVKLAQLAADLPEVRELDLNPLLADEQGVVAIDARIAVNSVAPARRGSHLAIRPYPAEWQRESVLLDGRRVLVRPIRPEDECLYPPFFERVNADDRRLRFFTASKDVSHTFFARFTQIDYARAMAFLAVDPDNGDMLGVSRLHANSTYDSGEYAILVRSDLKGHGIGWLLMQTLLEYARSEGIATITGQILRENVTMIAMCRELGFSIADDPNDNAVVVATLKVAGAPAPRA